MDTDSETGHAREGGLFPVPFRICAHPCNPWSNSFLDPVFVYFVVVHPDHQSTVFTSVPTGAIVIRISSPPSSVNVSSGTTPVPVMRKVPKGNLSSR